MAKKIRNLFQSRPSLSLLIAVAIVMGLFLSNMNSFLLRTSLVDLPQHAPFDGTVYPVEKVPDWVLVGGNNDRHFSEFQSNELVDIPYYDPSRLQISADTLEWGNSSHDLIRNEKITYSVPYLGDYSLSGVEGSGSHPAVDIKIPTGTPILSIMNGTVIKASNQSSGFGHHLVVRTLNVPGFEYLDCSYSHLGTLLVDVGDVVSRGQQIADSNDTGTATTPHLHFQCDTPEAPWSPFWPFTFSEASDAGYDFFGAVNAGLGQDKARTTTTHPIDFVQAHLTYEPAATPEVVIPAETAVEPQPEPEPVVEAEPVVETVVEPEPEPEVVEPEVVEEPQPEPQPEPEPQLDPPELHFDIDVQKAYESEELGSFKISLIDQYGREFEGGFTGNLVINSDDRKSWVKNKFPTIADFNADSQLEVEFKRLDKGQDRIVIQHGGKNYYSDWYEIVTEVELVFNDVPLSHEYYEEINYLAEQNILSGYPDGTFRSENLVSRVELLKILYEAINEKLSEGNVPFTDVSEQEWYYRYLYTAYDNGIVDGHPDNTFRPGDFVDGASFYKIMFNGLKIDTPPATSAPFSDVSQDAWFAPYFALAKDLGIIDAGRTTVEPAKFMTRGEVAKGIYEMMVKVNNL